MTYFWIALTLAGIIGTGWAAIRLKHQLDVFIMRRRFKRGKDAEAAALEYLEERGYQIVSGQQQTKGIIVVDGEEREYDLIIDLVVTRGGRTFGVEVKSGKMAINPEYSATRRQLLDYAHVYSFDGLFLLDMETPKFMRIEFPSKAQRVRKNQWRWWVAAGFVLGVLAARLIA
jgi:Holliday junction resolvase-like predicted endonuclease